MYVKSECIAVGLALRTIFANGPKYPQSNIPGCNYRFGSGCSHTWAPPPKVAL